MNEEEKPLTCILCGQLYTKQERCPRRLLCGHTLCTACLADLIETRNRKCPTCSRPFLASSETQLPTDFSIYKRLSYQLHETEAIGSPLPNLNSSPLNYRSLHETTSNLSDQKPDNVHSDKNVPITNRSDNSSTLVSATTAKPFKYQLPLIAKIPSSKDRLNGSPRLQGTDEVDSPRQTMMASTISQEDIQAIPPPAFNMHPLPPSVSSAISPVSATETSETRQLLNSEPSVRQLPSKETSDAYTLPRLQEAETSLAPTKHQVAEPVARMPSEMFPKTGIFAKNLTFSDDLPKPAKRSFATPQSPVPEIRTLLPPRELPTEMSQQRTVETATTQNLPPMYTTADRLPSSESSSYQLSPTLPANVSLNDVGHTQNETKMVQETQISDDSFTDGSSVTNLKSRTDVSSPSTIPFSSRSDNTGPIPLDRQHLKPAPSMQTSISTEEQKMPPSFSGHGPQTSSLTNWKPLSTSSPISWKLPTIKSQSNYDPLQPRVTTIPEASPVTEEISTTKPQELQRSINRVVPTSHVQPRKRQAPKPEALKKELPSQSSSAFKEQPTLRSNSSNAEALKKELPSPTSSAFKELPTLRTNSSNADSISKTVRIHQLSKKYRAPNPKPIAKDLPTIYSPLAYKVPNDTPHIRESTTSNKLPSIGTVATTKLLVKRIAPTPQPRRRSAEQETPITELSTSHQEYISDQSQANEQLPYVSSSSDQVTQIRPYTPHFSSALENASTHKTQNLQSIQQSNKVNKASQLPIIQGSDSHPTIQTNLAKYTIYNQGEISSGERPPTPPSPSTIPVPFDEEHMIAAGSLDITTSNEANPMQHITKSDNPNGISENQENSRYVMNNERSITVHKPVQNTSEITDNHRKSLRESLADQSVVNPLNGKVGDITIHPIDFKPKEHRMQTNNQLPNELTKQRTEEQPFTVSNRKQDYSNLGPVPFKSLNPSSKNTLAKVDLTKPSENLSSVQTKYHDKVLLGELQVGSVPSIEDIVEPSGDAAETNTQIPAEWESNGNTVHEIMEPKDETSSKASILPEGVDQNLPKPIMREGKMSFPTRTSGARYKSPLIEELPESLNHESVKQDRKSSKKTKEESNHSSNNKEIKENDYVTYNENNENYVPTPDEGNNETHHAYNNEIQEFVTMKKVNINTSEFTNSKYSDNSSDENSFHTKENISPNPNNQKAKSYQHAAISGYEDTSSEKEIISYKYTSKSTSHLHWSKGRASVNDEGQSDNNSEISARKTTHQRKNLQHSESSEEFCHSQEDSEINSVDQTTRSTESRKRNGEPKKEKEILITYSQTIMKPFKTHTNKSSYNKHKGRSYNSEENEAETEVEKPKVRKFKKSPIRSKTQREDDEEESDIDLKLQRARQRLRSTLNNTTSAAFSPEKRIRDDKEAKHKHVPRSKKTTKNLKKSYRTSEEIVEESYTSSSDKEAHSYSDSEISESFSNHKKKRNKQSKPTDDFFENQEDTYLNSGNKMKRHFKSGTRNEQTKIKSGTRETNYSDTKGKSSKAHKEENSFEKRQAGIHTKYLDHGRLQSEKQKSKAHNHDKRSTKNTSQQEEAEVDTNDINLKLQRARQRLRSTLGDQKQKVMDRSSSAERTSRKRNTPLKPTRYLDEELPKYTQRNSHAGNDSHKDSRKSKRDQSDKKQHHPILNDDSSDIYALNERLPNRSYSHSKMKPTHASTLQNTRRDRRSKRNIPIYKNARDSLSEDESQNSSNSEATKLVNNGTSVPATSKSWAYRANQNPRQSHNQNVDDAVSVSSEDFPTDIYTDFQQDYDGYGKSYSKKSESSNFSPVTKDHPQWDDAESSTLLQRKLSLPGSQVKHSFNYRPSSQTFTAKLAIATSDEDKPEREPATTNGKEVSNAGVGQCSTHGELLNLYCKTCEIWVCHECLDLVHSPPPNGHCQTIPADEAVGEMKVSHAEFFDNKIATLSNFKDELRKLLSNCESSLKEHEISIAQLSSRVLGEEMIIHGIENMKALVLQKWKQIDQWEDVLEDNALRIGQSASSKEIVNAIQTNKSSILVNIMRGQPNANDPEKNVNSSHIW